MSKHRVEGSVTLVKSTKYQEFYDLNLTLTAPAKKAFSKNPDKMMAEFLRRKGFTVNTVLVINPKRLKNALDAGTEIPAHSVHGTVPGVSASGWVWYPNWDAVRVPVP
jgi:hypothetical protein